MKQIALREFQLHAAKYIKELPITLTQYNLPVAIISAYASSSVEAQKTSITEVLTPVSISLDEVEERFPSTYMGKPLSGTKQPCTSCHKYVPVEFASQHYAVHDI